MDIPSSHVIVNVLAKVMIYFVTAKQFARNIIDGASLSLQIDILIHHSLAAFHDRKHMKLETLQMA